MLHNIKFEKERGITIYAKRGFQINGKNKKLYGLGKRTIWDYQKKGQANSKGHKREGS